MLCSYCGALNVVKHKHHTNMCVDCGKLYDRFRSAKKRNSAELGTIRELILARRCNDAHKQYYTMIYNTEVPAMETTRICKQCGRRLSLVDNYQKYAPRGKGVYNTEQGYHTICKQCEAISVRADNALKRGNEELVDKLREHYRVLESKGLPPVTAAAQRLMGYEQNKRGSNIDALLAEVQGANETELEEHCRLVRSRGYASFEEADEVHKKLVDGLKAAGLYEEINELMDEWYMEE